MLEYNGQITQVASPPTPLWCLPLLFLLAALACAALGPRIRRAGLGRGLAERLRLGRSGVVLLGIGASLLGSALAAVNLSALLGQDSARKSFHDVAWNLVRVGSLDVDLAFAMDRLGGAVSMLVALAVGALHVVAARRGAAGDSSAGAGGGTTPKAPARSEGASPSLTAALCLLAGGAVTVALADNLVVMVLGSEMLAAATALVILLWRAGASGAEAEDAPARAEGLSRASGRAFLAHHAGDAVILLGAATLFWGLGGRWTSDGRYLSDYRARFVAVHAGGGSGGTIYGAPEGEPDEPDAKRDGRRRTSLDQLRVRAGARGYLSFTGHPGAQVYLGIADRAQLAAAPEPFAVAPFLRKEISVGAHSVILVPGGGATVSGDGFEVAAIDRISVEPGEDIVLTMVGPTLSFREIADQLGLKDENGSAFLRKDLAGKKGWGGVQLVGLSCLLFMLGAALKSLQSGLAGWSSTRGTPMAAWVGAIAAAYAGVVLVLRLEPVFALGPVGSGAAALALLGLPFMGFALSRALLRKAEAVKPVEGGAS
ncbi:hypothetical protein [Chondromyces crocatus]|uniref:Uncharacterized protein n=1 Tax=Chondromyces crocatus TaxID=52 RepID=A0A0K1E7E4_CHOCO|nr:hypothetical protein [Chondromyces crocatus]AKT36806.1 uncharacterized protein CMC5_009270 [Chondromyces crocatus]